MEPTPDKEKRIRVGITHGDVNGISYEIIIKFKFNADVSRFILINIAGDGKFYIA